MHLRLEALLGNLGHVLSENLRGDGGALPVDYIVLVDINFNNLWLVQIARRHSHRHIQVDGMQLNWNRDDQHHQEHQHHVNQGCRVHIHHDFHGLDFSPQFRFFYCHTVNSFIKEYRFKSRSDKTYKERAGGSVINATLLIPAL